MPCCPCISCIDFDWDGCGPGLSRSTLRFHQPAQEAGFLAQRKVPLIAGFRRIVCIAIFTFMGGCGLLGLRLSGATNETAQQIRHVQLFVSAVLLSGLLLLWGVLRFGRLADRLGPTGIEVASTSLMTALLLFTLVLLKTSSLTRIFGHDYNSVFGPDAYDSDSSTVLSIDLLVTAFTLGMPVRWCVVFALDIGACLLYVALVVFIGSGEPVTHTVMNATLLTSLALLAGLGKRALEIHERVSFVNMIKERSLRATAEFHLSRAVREQDPSLLLETGSECTPKSNPESYAPSTASSKTFDAFQEDPLHPNRLDVVHALTRIAELGEAEHWRIQEREVKVLKDHRLGHGSFGVVAKGVFCGMIVAVKCPRKRLSDISLQRIPELSNELRVLRHLRHPNILALHGAVVNPQEQRMALVFELVRGVTLCQFMTEEPCSDKLEPVVLYQIMLGVCLALMYMHTRHPAMVHGDIKSENIMVEVLGEYVCPKLIDFGLSRLIGRSELPMGGTLAWMAPELVSGSGQVKCSADVYSYGRLLAFLATGIAPLSEFSDSQLKEMLTHGPPPLPTWPQTCFFGLSCKDLVYSCIRGQEAERPSMIRIHEKLTEFPGALGLADATGRVRENALLVSAHRGKDSAAQGKEVTSEVSTADPAAVGSILPIVPVQSPLSVSPSPPPQPRALTTTLEWSRESGEAFSGLPGQVESCPKAF